MHKLLISSLRSEYDLISSANLITSLHKEYPHSEIHMLVYEEMKSMAKAINYVTQVHTISRARIQKVLGSSLYHDGFGINLFMENMKEVLETHWSLVINHSNDNVSAYLISALDFSHVIGTSISISGTPNTSGVHNDYLNYVSPQITRQPVNLESVKFKMCSLKMANNFESIIVDEAHNTVAAQNFEKIRSTKNGTSTKIVGVSMSADKNDKHLDFNNLVNILEELVDSTEYHPVLLLKGSPEEKELVNKLNYHFKNNLISINSEMEALPSLLINLDLLISNNNSHLYFADAMGVKTIEVTDMVTSQRTSSAGSYSVVTSDQFYNEVLYILNVNFNTALAVETTSNLNPVYRIEKDGTDSFYTQVQGNVDIQNELQYHIARIYTNELLGHDKNSDFLNRISSQCDSKDLADFSKVVKERITECSKSLLSTLRNLKNIRTSKENQMNFIKHLDCLISASKENDLTNIPVLLFEAELNSIDNSNAEQSFSETEKSLFNLKNNFQRLNQILDQMFEKNRELPKHSAHSENV